MVTGSSPRRTPGAGVGVLRLLAAAAVTGVVAGIVLERSRPPPDALAQAEAVVDQVPAPIGAAGRRVPADVMAPDPASLRGIPPYPGATPRRLLGAAPERGLNAISWFGTEDSLERVLSHYEAEYSHAGIQFVTQRWGPRRGYVSWFERTGGADGGEGTEDTTQGVLHLVAASREGTQTMVFLAATVPDRIIPEAPTLPAGVRLPPGAETQVLDMGELGQQRATVFARYEQLGKEAVAEQLIAVMKEGGWTLTERTDAPDGRISLVAHDPLRSQMAVIEGNEGRSQVLVILEEREARPTSIGGSP
jgi:hypothetical protein